MKLRQYGFTYSTCGPFTQNKERTQKFKETGDSIYIYPNDKACFQHDMAFRDFKDLPIGTVAEYYVIKHSKRSSFNVFK